MLRKGIGFLICLTIQFCLFQRSANAQEVSADELIASFTSVHNFGSSTITFDTNGKFKIETGDCTTEYFSSGKYNFLSNVVNFNELNRKRQSRVFDELSLSRLSEEEKKAYYDEESFAENSRTSKMIPVKWAARLYLIDEEELENFCNAVNLGIEPRPELSSDPFYGAFYLRAGDEYKDVTGMPVLPGNWNGFFLKKPVTAKITKIEDGEKNEKIVTVNRGALSGLKIGMRLIKKNQAPSLWSDARVISVEKYSAGLSVSPINEELKIGQILTSRFVRSKIEEMIIRERREMMRKNQTTQ